MKLEKMDKFFIVLIITIILLGIWWWIFEVYQEYEGKVYYNEHKNEIDYAVERYENEYKEHYNII